jgi:anti-sigma B factor antagonist
LPAAEAVRVSGAGRPTQWEYVMAESSKSLTITPVKGVSVVEFTNNRILDENVLEDIRAALGQLVEGQTQPKLLLDFSQVDHMSSAALGLLINVHKAIREKNGQLRLCGIQPQIFEVFVTTKLNKVFRIANARQEAMDSFT